MNNEEIHTQLSQLAYQLKQMGSGLDAVDRGYGWGYFEEAKKQCEEIIKQLPLETQAKIAHLEPTIHSWSRFRTEVLRIRKQYPLVSE